jgi:hypothetical protein
MADNGRGQMHTRRWYENVRGRHRMQDLMCKSGFGWGSNIKMGLE